MRKLFKLLVTVALALIIGVSMVACADASNGKSGKDGLLFKKIDGVYTVYDYNPVKDEQGNYPSTLDIGAILSDAGINEEFNIKKGAFSGNSTIKTLIVPDTVKEIASGAFMEMSALEELVVPFIGRTAIANTNQLNPDYPTSPDLSNNSTRTLAHFFGSSEYDNGTPITINYGASTVTCYMPFKLSKVTIKTSRDYLIPMYAFNGATNISAVVLDGNVKAIGEYAFKGCTALKEISLPVSATIYTSAFEGCSALSKVTIVSAVANGSVKVMENAFKGCTALSYFGEVLASYDAVKKIDLAKVNGDIGANAFALGNENATYTILNASAVNGYVAGDVTSLVPVFGELDITIA